MKYEITKKFVNGLLNGLEITEITTVKFTVGKTYKSCTGSDYKIVKCEEIA